MKSATAPLIALLGGQTSNFVKADLFTLSLLNGTVLRYTDVDRAMTYGGNTWGIGPLIKRGRIRWGVGIEVDQLDLSISAGDDVTASAPSLPGDDYAANVSLLLHADGANGSTTITDSSSDARTMTAVGNAQLTTSDYKFAPSCMIFDGVGDRVTTPGATRLHLATGDFTIEFWIKTASAAGVIVMCYGDAGTTTAWQVYFDGAGTFRFVVPSEVGGAAPVSIFANSVADNTWHHIAVTRTGSTFRMFKDGVNTDTGTYAGDIRPTASGYSLVIGSYGGGAAAYTGKVDEVRITYGVSRYTANFTPSDAPFSASAPTPGVTMPLMKLIALGGLDGARVTVERLFAASWDSAPAGKIHLFSGRTNEIDIDRYEARVRVTSDLELLDIMVPRNVYQPSCLNTLYDAQCGVQREALAVAAAVTSVTSATAIYSSSLAQAAGYFDLGIMRCTTGANAGRSRTVRSFASGVVEVVAPWPFPMQVGDAFTIYPGCDKTKATCNTKFANLARFRGFPFVPVPETVM